MAGIIRTSGERVRTHNMVCLFSAPNTEQMKKGEEEVGGTRWSIFFLSCSVKSAIWLTHRNCVDGNGRVQLVPLLEGL